MLGIPEEFRPRIILDWWGRGENALKERRAELRKVAQTRIEAMAKQALVAIETRALEGQTRLAAGALESAEAQKFLASMPTVEMLMPGLDVSALGPFARSRPSSVGGTLGAERHGHEFVQALPHSDGGQDNDR